MSVQVTSAKMLDAGACIFAGIVAIWGTWFVENWKREESRLVTRWGMTNFEDQEEERPEFNGTMRPSDTIGTVEAVTDPVTGEVCQVWKGKPVLWTDPEQRSKRMRRGWLIIGIMICVVIGCISGIIVMRSILSNLSPTKKFAGIIAGLVNFIQVSLCVTTNDSVE